LTIRTKEYINIHQQQQKKEEKKKQIDVDTLRLASADSKCFAVLDFRLLADNNQRITYKDVIVRAKVRNMFEFEV
jgi:ABC-type transporter Mla MlaB component